MTTDKQQLCSLPVQYMKTAMVATTVVANGTHDSQLAIHLVPITMDPTITQWAMARYAAYHIHPQPPPLQTSTQLPLPNPNLPAPTAMVQTAPGIILQQVPVQNAPGTIPQQPQQPGPTHTNQQIIDILDDETNPPPTNPAPGQANQHLVNIALASISATFRTIHKLWIHPCLTPARGCHPGPSISNHGYQPHQSTELV